MTQQCTGPKQMTNLRVMLERRSGVMAESIRYEASVISARDSDSSHKYTRQGVKLPSSATIEKAAETGISRTCYANVG